MAKFARVVTGALTTSGTCDITSVQIDSFDGAIIYVTKAQTLDADYAQAMLSTCYFDGTDAIGLCAASEDNSSRQDCGIGGYPGIILLNNDGSVIDARGTLSKITNGVRITWDGSYTPDAAYEYMAILFFGGVSLKCGYIIASGTVNGTATYSGTTFTPQIGLFNTVWFASNYAGASIISIEGQYNSGILTYKNSVITQRSCNYYDEHDEDRMDGRIVAINVSIGDFSDSTYLKITEVNSSGFVVTTLGGSEPYPTLFFFLIGGVHNVSLDDTPCPSSTGIKSWEGPNFQPDFILMTQTVIAAYNTVYEKYGDVEDLNFAFGAHDGIAGGGISIWSRAYVDTSDTGSRTNSTNFLTSRQTTASEQFSATFDSFDSLGYNINYTEIQSNDIGFTLAIQFESAPASGYWAIDGTFNKSF